MTLTKRPVCRENNVWIQFQCSHSKYHIATAQAQAQAQASKQTIEREEVRFLTRGKGLLELVRLVRVGHAEGVQVLAAAHLEFGLVARLLDFDGCRKDRGKGHLSEMCHLCETVFGGQAFIHTSTIL